MSFHLVRRSLIFILLCLPLGGFSQIPREDLCVEARDTMKKAATVFYAKASSHGGYVYYYSPDFTTRLGEGEATKDQAWVEPPGTPMVGMAFLKAYEATGDPFYMEAATDAARALIYGQLKSGGWAAEIDFDPQGNRSADYRNGKGHGKNNTSLDDGVTQSALQFMMHMDKATDFKNEEIHEATQYALDAFMKAQFPNGAFPQGWDQPVAQDLPIVPAAFPDYDWRTEGRIKEYWDLYTLNDDVAGYAADTLIDAYRICQNPKFLESLRRLGDFLILAQLPAPQRGWAQQYSFEMIPVWARKFEPPAVASDETQEAISTLMDIYEVTGDPKYLQPIPAAISYLRESLLPDGQLARFYELQTNRPLYMVRDGKGYNLTYDDSDLPSHYGWKITPKVDRLEERYNRLLAGAPEEKTENWETRAREILVSSWVTTYEGQGLKGQPKFKTGEEFISSQEFSRRLSDLSEFLMADCQAD